MSSWTQVPSLVLGGNQLQRIFASMPTLDKFAVNGDVWCVSFVSFIHWLKCWLSSVVWIRCQRCREGMPLVRFGQTTLCFHYQSLRCLPSQDNRWLQSKFCFVVLGVIWAKSMNLLLSKLNARLTLNQTFVVLNLLFWNQESARLRAVAMSCDDKFNANWPILLCARVRTWSDSMPSRAARSYHL